MSLINLIVVLIVVGVLLWLVQNYIPMDATIKRIIVGVIVIVVVLWLLGVFLGGYGGLESIRIGPR